MSEVAARPAATGADRAALILAGILVISAAWTGGAMSPWATGLYGLAGALLLALVAAEPQGLLRRRGPGRRWLGAGVAGLLALASFQLLPLGPLLGLVSPQSAALRAPFGAGGVDPLGCVALYPEHARHALIGLTVAAALLLVTAQLAELRDARLLAGALSLGALAQALYGALSLPSWGMRAVGSYLSPNHFGGLLALCLPLALALSGVYGRERGAGRERRRVLWGLVAAGLALGLVLSRSRSAVLGAAVALVVQAWLGRGESRGRGRVLVSTLGALGLVFLTAGWHALGRRFEAAASGAEGLRIEFWGVGLEVWSRFPLFGSGLRAHDELTPSLLDHPLLANASHNDYINALADLGLAGALCLVIAAWGYGRAFRSGWAGGGRERGARELAGGVAGALAGLAFMSLVEFNLQIRANLWASAAIAGLGLAALRPARPAGPRTLAWSKGLGLALLAAALVLATAAARLTASAYALERGLQVDLGPAQQELWLRRARRFSSADAEPEAELGRLLHRTGRYLEAEAALRRAAQRRPRHAPYQVDLARSAYAAGHLEQGDAALEGSEALAPHFCGPRLEAARLWRWRAGRPAPGEARAACLRALGQVLAQDPVLAREDLLLPAMSELIALPDPEPAEAAAAFAEVSPARRRAAAVWFARTGRERVHRHRAASLGRALLEPLLGPEADPFDLTLAGEMELRSGRPSAALELWLRSYAEAPDPTRTLSSACELLESKALGLLAIQFCERATARRPEAVAGWLQLGLRYQRRGSWTDATRALEHAASLDPLAAGLALGDCYAAQGLRQSALSAWRRAQGKALKSALRSALGLRIGRTLLAEGDAAGALREAEGVSSLEPKNEAARSLAREAEALRQSAPQESGPPRR